VAAQEANPPSITLPALLFPASPPISVLTLKEGCNRVIFLQKRGLGFWFLVEVNSLVVGLKALR
jgi:hypothetical protein